MLITAALRRGEPPLQRHDPQTPTPVDAVRSLREKGWSQGCVSALLAASECALFSGPVAYSRSGYYAPFNVDRPFGPRACADAFVSRFSRLPITMGSIGFFQQRGFSNEAAFALSVPIGGGLGALASTFTSQLISQPTGARQKGWMFKGAGSLAKGEMIYNATFGLASYPVSQSMRDKDSSAADYPAAFASGIFGGIAAGVLSHGYACQSFAKLGNVAPNWRRSARAFGPRIGMCAYLGASFNTILEMQVDAGFPRPAPRDAAKVRDWVRNTCRDQWRAAQGALQCGWEALQAAAPWPRAAGPVPEMPDTVASVP